MNPRENVCISQNVNQVVNGLWPTQCQASAWHQFNTILKKSSKIIICLKMFILGRYFFYDYEIYCLSLLASNYEIFVSKVIAGNWCHYQFGTFFEKLLISIIGYVCSNCLFLLRCLNFSFNSHTFALREINEVCKISLSGQFLQLTMYRTGLSTGRWVRWWRSHVIHSPNPWPHSWHFTCWIDSRKITTCLHFLSFPGTWLHSLYTEVDGSFIWDIFNSEKLSMTWRPKEPDHQPGIHPMLPECSGFRRSNKV